MSVPSMRILLSLPTLLCLSILLLPPLAKGADLPTSSKPALNQFRVTRYQWVEKDGLPDWNITCFMQDSRGLIWMVSRVGLSTFDGHSFRLLHSVNAIKKTAKILRMAEDRHGHIWLIRMQNNVVTVDILDPVTEKVRPLHEYLSQKKPIRIPVDDGVLLVYNVGGRIWIGSRHTGFLYDGAWKKVPIQGPPSTKRWYPAEDGQLWFQKGNDLYLGKGQPTQYRCFTNDGFALRWVWLDSTLTLWAAYSKPGQTPIDHYYKLTPHGSAIRTLYFRATPKTGWINAQNIFEQRLKAINQQLLLTETPDGLFMGRPDSPWMIQLSRQYSYIGDMLHLYFDRSGGLWSCNTNGLTRMVLSHPPFFETYLTDSKPTHSLRGIAQNNNLLYVLSYGGARQMDLSNKKIAVWAYPNNRQGLAMLSYKGILWVGLHANLMLAIRPNGALERYPMKGIEVFVQYASPSLGLFVGTNKGVYRLNTNTKTFEPVALNGCEVFTFHENQQGLWAGTNQGLYLLDQHLRVQRKWLPPSKELPYERMEHLHRDRDGLFWIATKGAGLIRWNPNTGAARKYIEKDGLSNRNLHAVYEDTQGFLWLPSDFGLMRFHKASGQVQAFFKGDGIADNEFNAMSHYRDTSGRLYFGGINGLTAFHPDDFGPILKSEHEPVLIEAKAFNLKRGTYARQLVNASRMEKLTLSPSYAYLDLHFSPLLYRDSRYFLYSWKIKGLQRNWIKQRSPVIRLSNLPYGKNTLQVRFSPGGSSWSSKILEIPIQVLRPFYLRWPFFTFLSLLVIGFALSFSYFYNGQLLRANLRLEQAVRQRTQQVEADKQTIGQQAERLKAINETKSRFFANVTHELRTPLTLVLSPAEHLIKNSYSHPSSRVYLNTIYQNSKKLLDLVDQLLNVLAIESNELMLEEKPANIYSLISRLFANFTPHAEYRKISLNLHFECAYGLVLLLDSQKFEQIISNLLNNALKFSKNGGNVTLLVQIKADSLLIQVSDNGRGIHPEDLPFIFDRYFQSKLSEANALGGIGIGLSLCREYTHLMGGTLNVQSEWGQGSVFTLILPSKYPRNPTLANHTEADYNTVAQLQKPIHLPERNTVLIVEDDLNMACYTQSLLENRYNVLIADNGKTALQQINQYPIDLILSDIRMPEMDGFQLLETVRMKNLDIPFVFLSALMGIPNRIRAFRLGVDDYLTKPFLEDELYAILQNLLQRLKARRDLAALQANNDNEGSPLSVSYDQKWLLELETMVLESISDPDFSIAQLAAKMHLSIRALQYKIKYYTGLTAVNYLSEVRLVTARTLLESHRYETISEVCHAVGFKTKHYFARRIKERFGKLPSEF